MGLQFANALCFCLLRLLGNLLSCRSISTKASSQKPPANKSKKRQQPTGKRKASAKQARQQAPPPAHPAQAQ
jgi:hypothetical protein